MKNTALLVIDVQESFKQRPYWSEQDFQPYAQRQKQLIDIAHQHDWQVIYILHNEANGVFSPASGFVRFMDFLKPHENEPTFHKKVHNALTESGLQDYLQQQKISKLIVSGIRTEQCCETTARIASDLGYEVDFVLDATLTFAMKHPLTGEMISAQHIRAHTAMVLQDRFANVRFVADYATH